MHLICAYSLFVGVLYRTYAARLPYYIVLFTLFPEP